MVTLGCLGQEPSDAAPSAAASADVVRLDPHPGVALGVGNPLAVSVDDAGDGALRITVGSSRADSAVVYEIAYGGRPAAGSTLALTRAQFIPAPADSLPGTPCPFAYDLATGQVLAAHGLSSDDRSVVTWTDRPTDGGRYVANVTASPSGSALGLLVTDVPPTPSPFGLDTYRGPFAHEVYALPSLARVAGPEPVAAHDGGLPAGPCWTPSGRVAVYVFDLSAVAVVDGLRL